MKPSKCTAKLASFKSGLSNGFFTAANLLSIMAALKEKYGGLERLHRESGSSSDLERRLQEFKGFGPVGVNIFLRELRPYWTKADPEPLPLVLELARRYALGLGALKRKSVTFTRIEAGLVRLRKESKKAN